MALVGGSPPDGIPAYARAAGPQGIFSNADIWPETRVADRFAVVGDAAGTNDPSIGHGNSLALRDVRELRDAVRANALTMQALKHYAVCRAQYYGTRQEYAQWMGGLWLEEGPDADDRRTRFRSARETYPDAGGFNT